MNNFFFFFKKRALKKLNLENCKLIDEGTKILMKEMLKMPFLTSINMSANSISDDSFPLICEYITKGKFLQELYLNFN